MSRTTTFLGEESELVFQLEGSRRGLIISRPHGNKRYDFITDSHGVLNRVQVKSTLKPKNPTNLRYEIVINKRKVYSVNELEIFALHLVDIDLWYFIPVEILVGKSFLSLYPHGRKSIYNNYIDNWEIFSSSRKTDL